MLITHKYTTRAIITALYGWCNDKIAEAVHSMDCYVTLAIESVEYDQRFVVTHTTMRLVRKSDILPSFLSETNMEVCLNCILFFPMSGKEYFVLCGTV